MLHRNFQNIDLPALGLGCMRLPVVEGKDGQVDLNAVGGMVAKAMENGVNYFDTAWGYHGGQSETAMGEVLKAYPRNSFYLASKFPGYDISNMSKAAEIFEQQLKKCQTEYFDFYLFHNVTELNIDAYLDPAYGLLDYMLEQKRNGRIRHLGFSTHGKLETMERFLDAWGEHMEFCQIQLNWLDWDFQFAKDKVRMLNERNIPIWVMEPIRGGALVNLSEEHEAKLKALRPQWSNPEWSFRFLQDIPGVTVILSGMSNLTQLEENIETFRESNPMTAEEIAALLQISKEKTSLNTLPCTNCRYCTNHCPMELNIPMFIEAYNEYLYNGSTFRASNAMSNLPDEKKPTACVGCRSCEGVCPQNIKISEMMQDYSEKFG